MATKNLVSQPPLNASVIDQQGHMSRAWSIFMRDLYKRVAYKGGNSIDDLALELIKLALRVTQNEEDILDLQERVAALEYRVFDIVNVTTDITLEEFKIAICKNTTPITVTLKLLPVIGDEIQVKRTDAEVTIIGLIDGEADIVLNVINYSLYLVFNGTDWSTI